MKNVLFSLVIFSFLLIPFSQINAQESMMGSHDEMVEMVRLMENGQLDAESQGKLAEHVNFLIDEKMDKEMMGESMMDSYHFGTASFMSTSPFFQVVHILFIFLILLLLTMLNILLFKKLKERK